MHNIADKKVHLELFQKERRMLSVSRKTNLWDKPQPDDIHCVQWSYNNPNQ